MMDQMDERGPDVVGIVENRPNQILLQCELCDFRTTDGNLIHAHLAENHHRSNTMESCQNWWSCQKNSSEIKELYILPFICNFAQLSRVAFELLIRSTTQKQAVDSSSRLYLLTTWTKKKDAIIVFTDMFSLL